MRTLLFVTSLFLTLLAAPLSARAHDAEGKPQPGEAVRAIPGLTAPDQYPQGCVDCHVNFDDRGDDYRLSTLMKKMQTEVDPALLAKVRSFTPADIQLSGVHPDVGADFFDSPVPDTCMDCHDPNGGFAPPMDRMMHGLHLTGGEDNHFISLFGGECTHCHKFDAKTGVWSIGSGPETK